MIQTSQSAGSGAANGTIRLVIAIPARLGSTRLPRKPLALLKGKPLIERVADRVSLCVSQLYATFGLTPDDVLTFVATDSTDIEQALKASGMLTVMTPSELTSGTDRILSAIDHLPSQLHQRLSPETLVINLQGDEPFFSMTDVESLIRNMFDSPELPMGTLAFERSDPEMFFKTSVVKVVCDGLQQALYFSRSPIPWPREFLGASESVAQMQNQMGSIQNFPFLQHVGIYAYRMDALRRFTHLQSRFLEQTEGLEQLRALEAGWKIKIIRSFEPPFGIDTPEDLQRAELHLSDQGLSS